MYIWSLSAAGSTMMHPSAAVICVFFFSLLIAAFTFFSWSVTFRGAMTYHLEQGAAEAFTDSRQLWYSLVASYCLQLHEFFSCMENEYRLIHRSRWSSVKIAYLLCRYYPLCIWPWVCCAYLSDRKIENCKQMAIMVQAFLMPLVFLPRAVMVLRTYAFSGRVRIVVIVLSITFALIGGAYVWAFLAQTTKSSLKFYPHPTGVGGCYPNYRTKFVRRWIGLSIIATAFVDFVCLCIILWYCRRTRGSRGSLVNIFVQQGLAAFIFMSIMEAVTLIIFFSPQTQSTIGLPILITVANILSCRLYVVPMYRGVFTF
ncbi:hypothetical protein BD779DRAFT_477718 [Infundibulicybe gibba]|nr:hypothetical protein BD779DRAFT_477718 [Infundibulicybe gibba]